MYINNVVKKIIVHTGNPHGHTGPSADGLYGIVLLASGDIIAICSCNRANAVSIEEDEWISRINLESHFPTHKTHVYRNFFFL